MQNLSSRNICPSISSRAYYNTSCKCIRKGKYLIQQLNFISASLKYVSRTQRYTLIQYFSCITLYCPARRLVWGSRCAVNKHRRNSFIHFLQRY